MKHFFRLLCILILLINSTATAQKWRRVPSGTSNRLTGILFVDNEYGWIKGDAGTLLHTDDGGLTWDLSATNPINEIGLDGGYLESLHVFGDKIWVSGIGL